MNILTLKLLACVIDAVCLNLKNAACSSYLANQPFYWIASLRTDDER